MTEIIAHRGGALLWPENSLLACRQAVALGVDQVQVDVRLSADGEVVVIHDATLDRTTVGSGSVHFHAWAELSTIRLRDAPAETLPSLSTIARILAGSGSRLRLELKRAPDQVRTDLPERAIHVLQQTGTLDQAIITSFDEAMLHRARATAPNLPLGWLLDGPATSTWSAGSIYRARQAGWGTIGVRHDRVERAFRAEQATAGLRVCYFGVDDAIALSAALEANVDEISTDRPDLGLRLRQSSQV